MSYAPSASFTKRTRIIRRNNRLVARGAGFEIGPDGLLTLRKRRQVPLAGLLRGMIFFAAVLIAAKVVMLSGVGAEAYGDSLGALNGGSVFEKAGAFLLQADGLTQFLAAKLSSLLG